MDAVEEFLASTVERHARAVTGVRNGEPSAMVDLLSEHDPVTLFPAAQAPQLGFQAVSAAFRRVANAYSGASPVEVEVVAAGASGDLGYLVGYERGTATVGTGAPEQVDLRVTQVYRREDGDWKLVHRHAVPEPESRAAVDALRASIPR